MLNRKSPESEAHTLIPSPLLLLCVKAHSSSFSFSLTMSHVLYLSHRVTVQELASSLYILNIPIVRF